MNKYKQQNYLSKRACKNLVSSTGGFTLVELLIVIVVIAILAAVTIVAYNGITQRAKTANMAAELTQWKRKSELHKTANNIDCPVGYVFIYGNSVLGTSDFCVMKYEAKNVGGVPVSQSAGLPWVNISQTSVISTAATTGAHLITEAEWMTIAADILSVKYNWSGGSVGNGIVYQGHVNGNPGSALSASDVDSDNLNGITGGTGNTAGTNNSRALVLTSGDYIWDFSGNVWEWTQQSIGTPGMVMNQVGVIGDTTFNFRDWTLGTLSPGNLPIISTPGGLASYRNPVTGVNLNSVSSWDYTKGIGRVYANYADTLNRAFMRGGTFSDGQSSGVLSLKLNDAPGNAYSNIGFRLAK